METPGSGKLLNSLRTLIPEAVPPVRAFAGPQGLFSKCDRMKHGIAWRKKRKVTAWTNHSDLHGSTLLRYIFFSKAANTKQPKEYEMQLRT